MRLLSLTLLFSICSTAFAQVASDTTKPFVLDSLHKIALEEFKKATEAREKSDVAINNAIIDEALKNADNTTRLVLNNYPASKVKDDILRLKNLEEFTCVKCRGLDLAALFNQLAQLHKLKKLDLSGGTYKIIPNNIKWLTKLESLNLKDNNMAALPDSIVFLQQLKVLNLEHCAYLYDDNVYALLKHLNVEDLNFSASGFFEINNGICEVKSLKRLDVSVNDIKAVPDSFNRLTKLEYLNLGKNLNLDLTRSVVALAALPALKELLLSECSITSLPLDIGKIVTLQKLDLKGNKLSDIPLTFGNLANLEYLDLGYFEMGSRMNKISDLGPGFGNLKKLKYLNLAGNQLATLPEGFAGLTDLTELNLSLNKLPGFPQSVTKLTRLKNLDLSLNEGGSIPEAVGNLTALEVLHLDGNFFVQAEKKIKVLPAQLCQLTNLRELTLKDNVIEQLPDCIGNLAKLEKLDLRDNLLASLPASFTQLKSLKWLDLKSNEITALPADFYNLAALKEFNLSMNIQMNYQAEKPKFMKMQQLEYLDLSYNHIPKEAIIPLREALPNCKVINWDYKK
jgi:Leucine-rich repeat (LRR) protein